MPPMGRLQAYGVFGIILARRTGILLGLSARGKFKDEVSGSERLGKGRGKGVSSVRGKRPSVASK